MKHSLLFPLLVMAWILPGEQAATAAVIDLSRPVGESLAPTAVYWKFDEGETGTSEPGATDHSGNGLTGELSPSDTNVRPTYTGGRFGQGVLIEGSSATARDPNVLWDGRSADLDASKLDFAGKSFTAGLWLKLNEIDTGSNQTIFLIERGLSVYTSPTATQRNFFSLRLNKWQDDTWSLNLMLGDGVQPSVNVGAGVNFSTLNDLDWHHLAFSLEVTETGSRIAFWLDGERLGNEGFAGLLLPAITKASEKEFRVGERNSSAFQSAFHGVVDEVFITEGVHTFMIPEPSVAMLLPLAGLGWLVWRKAGNKR